MSYSTPFVDMKKSIFCFYVYTMLLVFLSLLSTVASHDVFNAVQAAPACGIYNTANTGTLSLVCPDMDGRSVYIPQDASIAYLEKSLISQQYLFRVTDKNTGCNYAFAAYLCAKVLNPCSDPPLTVSKPCTAICTDLTSKCATLMAVAKTNAPALVPDCTSSAFSSDTATCNNYAAPATPTETGSLVSYIPYPTPLCPAPLVVPDVEGFDTILGGLCASPCPMAMWTHDEYSDLDNILMIVSVLSLVTAGFLTVTWLVFKQQRQKRYILFFIGSVFIMIFFLFVGLLISGSANVAQNQCENNVTRYHMKGFCLFQSMITVYFVLAALCWWCVQAVDVFLKIYLGKRFPKGSVQENRKEIIYHSFCWGIPGICLIGALGSEQLGAHAIGASWCLFNKATDDTKIDVSYLFFYFPLLIICVIGTVCMVMTVFTIITSSKQAKNALKISSFMRMFLFIILVGFIWVYLLVYKLLSYLDSDSWTKGLVKFFTCLLLNPDGSAACGAHPSTRMDYGLMVTLHVVISIPGLFVFMLYGTSLDIYQAWAGFYYDKFGISCCKRYSGRGLYSQDQSKTETKGTTKPDALSQDGGTTDRMKPKRGIFAKSNVQLSKSGPGAAYSSREEECSSPTAARLQTYSFQSEPASPTASASHGHTSPLNNDDLSSSTANVLTITDTEDIVLREQTQVRTQMPRLPSLPQGNEDGEQEEDDFIPPPPTMPQPPPRPVRK